MGASAASVAVGLGVFSLGEEREGSDSRKAASVNGVRGISLPPSYLNLGGTGGDQRITICARTHRDVMSVLLMLGTSDTDMLVEDAIFSPSLSLSVLKDTHLLGHETDKNPLPFSPFPRFFFFSFLSPCLLTSKKIQISDSHSNGWTRRSAPTGASSLIAVRSAVALGLFSFRPHVQSRGRPSLVMERSMTKGCRTRGPFVVAKG